MLNTYRFILFYPLINHPVALCTCYSWTLRCRDREDFVQLVMEHGENLPGKAGNYRIAKFPGTERILFKTNFSKAFKDKAWYPRTFILPEEKAPALMNFFWTHVWSCLKHVTFVWDSLMLPDCWRPTFVLKTKVSTWDSMWQHVQPSMTFYEHPRHKSNP